MANIVSGCGLVKYTITSDKPTVLNIVSQKSENLKPNSTTKTIIASTTASVFTDSGSTVNLEFYPTANHALIDDIPNKQGVYTFTIEATLNTYPLMDEFLRI